MTETTEAQPYMHADYLAEVWQAYPTAGALIEWQQQEIERLRTTTSWRPIATAPRDGTPIIVWVRVARGPGWPETVVPHIDMGDMITWQQAKGSIYGFIADYWMPAPLPPKATPETESDV